MNETIQEIAKYLKLDPKIVASIYKEGFIYGLEARENDINIGAIRNELSDMIHGPDKVKI